MNGFTPSRPVSCNQMAPPSGATATVNEKKGQQSLSLSMNAAAFISIPWVSESWNAYPFGNSRIACIVPKTSLVIAICCFLYSVGIALISQKKGARESSFISFPCECVVCGSSERTCFEIGSQNQQTSPDRLLLAPLLSLWFIWTMNRPVLTPDIYLL